ncbi:hypothetical protein JCM8097_005197 [Rhodosporidiobolus ruineniae]
MWSKVAKLASPAPRKASSSASKPAADEAAFLRLVAQLKDSFSSATAQGEARTPAQARESTQRLLGELLRILKAEHGSAGGSSTPVGACTEVLLRDGVLAELVELVERGQEDKREELVRWYGRAIVEMDEAWLCHSAVNKPLVKLLRCCVDEDGGLRRAEELAVVEVMCVVAERIKTRPELLAIFFREKAGSRRQKDLSSSIAAAINRPVPFTTLSSDADGPPSSPTLSQVSASEASASFAPSQTSSVTHRQRSDHDFLLFSYLLRFIHREGEVGDYAREGILSLVDVAFGYPDLYNPSFSLQRSSSSTTISPSSGLVTPPPASSAAAREAVLAFAEFLLDSDFAEVLGAGLGALYGLLPSKLVVRAGVADGAATPQNGEPSMAGGMVLGGMGALHSEEDAEALERKREEEEDRLRAEGYGLSGTGEFREGLDGLLKLVEFTQEILRRSTDGVLLELGAVDEDDEVRQQKLVMSALTAAVLGAVRKLFLENVVYPSILECSETDGSAVAVMSYLDAILEVVQEGTKLESAVLGFLVAEDDSSSLDQRPRPRPSNASTSSSPSVGLLSPQPSTKPKRRKSSALLLIERAADPSSAAATDYFSSLGRFSLRDLLLSHVHSASQPTAAAALKLLQTVLTRHDRWSLALLDVVLDESATSFPIALREPPPEVRVEDDDSVDEFVYRSAAPQQDDSSDEDEFVYRPSKPRPPAPAAPRTAFPSTPARASQRLLGSPLPSTPSVSLHLDSLDTLLSLVATIDPSYRRMRSSGGGSEMLATGFSSYLRDAEATLANDAGFRRGLALPPTAGGAGAEHGAPEEGGRPAARRRRSTLFGSASSLSGRDFAAARTGVRHKLRPSAKLVALLLEALAAFFSHGPDVNLALTAVLAAMATCPYRSLEGWLLPVVKPVRAGLDEDELPARRKKGEEKGEKEASPMSNDGDDRSVDHDVDERGRHDALLSPLPSRSSTPSTGIFGFSTPTRASSSSTSADYLPPSATRAALASSDSLLSVLDALAKSVEQYRRQIPGFDTFLAERRQGLFFADNLADALQADELGGGVGGGVEENAFSLRTPPPVPSPPVEPVKKSSGGLGFGGFFSPRRASHNRSPSSPVNAFSTPTKPSSSSHAPARPSNLRRSASDDSLVLPTSPPPAASTLLAPPATAGVAKDGPASPFAAHYRQTGAITVEPIVVSTPGSARRRAAWAGGDETEEEEEEEGEDEGGVGSPTKRLSSRPSPSPRPTSPTTSTATTSSSFRPSPARQQPQPPAKVSLSTVLDNVIVLEEFVKEVAAIVYVRRAVGVDAVSFV